MKITKIQAGVKNPERCNIYVDGEFALAIPNDGVFELGLKVGSELSADGLERLQRYDIQRRALAKGLDFLSRRNYGRKELVRKLTAKDFDRETAEAACEELERRGMLNDDIFAQMLYEHLKQKNYGTVRLRQEMSLKGLDREVIDRVLEENETGPDEAAIRQIIEKKLRFAKEYDEKLKKRVYDQLQRYGYRYGEVKPLVEAYFEEEQD